MEPKQPLPSGPFLLDGKRADRLTPTQLAEVAARSALPVATVGKIVDHLADIEAELPLTMERLVEAVRQVDATHAVVRSMYPFPSLDDLRIGWELAGTDIAAELEHRLGGASGAGNVPGAQAVALNAFLAGWPGFGRALTGTGPGQYGVNVEFQRTVNRVQGAVYQDRLLRVGAFPGETTLTFVRTFVHEAGHATFQRYLIGDRLPMLVDQPDDTGTVTGDARTEAAQFWSQRSPAAREFYEAWMVLRRKPACLLGLDLGFVGSPEKRVARQVESFAEFCAEVFMQMATNVLPDHVLTVLDRDASQDVLKAWITVVRGLRAFARTVEK
ncbi:MAG TPA: hypothetical protein VMU51_33200 [Mycobacteriales bacterium]|nr:hypothetical protein [Mycobacteriales bacterium]